METTDKQSELPQSGEEADMAPQGKTVLHEELALSITSLFWGPVREVHKPRFNLPQQEPLRFAKTQPTWMSFNRKDVRYLSLSVLGSS